MTRITIMKTALGWEAMVFEGDRPRGEALPLPYAPTVPTRQVAIELLRRFPGCEVHCSAGGVAYGSPMFVRTRLASVEHKNDGRLCLPSSVKLETGN
jgi:hypothetical protein